jgi:quaternary ammonium compound-resistance protein SugE
VYWLVLVLSGVLEAVWATALGRSEGFTRLAPSLVFAAALVASMGGLALAMRALPIGTAYAVWVGIGAVGAAVMGIWLFGESASVPKLVSLALIVAGIVGLKLSGPA